MIRFIYFPEKTNLHAQSAASKLTDTSLCALKNPNEVCFHMKSGQPWENWINTVMLFCSVPLYSFFFLWFHFLLPKKNVDVHFHASFRNLVSISPSANMGTPNQEEYWENPCSLPYLQIDPSRPRVSFIIRKTSFECKRSWIYLYDQLKTSFRSCSTKHNWPK